MEFDSAASDLPKIRLRVRRPGVFDLDRAILALGDLSWLGQPMDGPPDGSPRRYVATDLDLPILDGSSKGSVRKAAFIDLGSARRVGDLRRARARLASHRRPFLRPLSRHPGRFPRRRR